MDEPPKLPDRTSRLHRLRWNDLIEKRGFDGDHLRWHQSRDRRHRAAKPRFTLAAPPPTDIFDRSPAPRQTYYGPQGEPISYEQWKNEKLAAWVDRENDPVFIDSIGVSETIGLAKAGFEAIVGDYLWFWADENGNTDDFVRWLEGIKDQVVQEVAGLWEGEWHAAWFDRACRQKVGEALAPIVKDWKSRAAALEMKHLENPHLSLRSLLAGGDDLNLPSAARVRQGSQAYWDAFEGKERQTGLGSEHTPTSGSIGASPTTPPTISQPEKLFDDIPPPELCSAPPKPGAGMHIEEQATTSEMPATDDASGRPLKTGKRLGRRANNERRDAIRNVMSKQGDPWRDHLSEIFSDLDDHNVSLGDFQGREINLGEGQSIRTSKWADLEFAEGEQRKQLIDALRKYT